MELLQFLNKDCYPDREVVTAVFADQDLPTLLYMLTEKRARALWDRLVPLIMHLGNPDLSVPVLIRFVEQDDSYTPDELAKINAKADAVYALGTLGGEKAEAYLRSVVTKAGAERAAARWIDNDLPDPYGHEKNFIVELQHAAALGLIETGKSENIAVVEKLHEDSLKRAEALSQLLSHKLTRKERDFLHLFDCLSEALLRRDMLTMIASGRKSEDITWHEVTQVFKRYNPRSVLTVRPVSQAQ